MREGDLRESCAMCEGQRSKTGGEDVSVCWSDRAGQGWSGRLGLTADLPGALAQHLAQMAYRQASVSLCLRLHT